MPFKIVRNDITKMKVDAIVNTANEDPTYGEGTDTAVYQAAGEDKLLAARRKIGVLKQGQVAITPGFKLPAKYIIHAVSPFYEDGTSGEEELLRSCYEKSLKLALKHRCKSIAFPLIATGSFGYPKAEGMEIALNVIHNFLMKEEMMVYLVVFDDESVRLSGLLYDEIEAFIDENYVAQKQLQEYMICECSKPLPIENLSKGDFIDVYEAGNDFIDEEDDEDEEFYEDEDEEFYEDDEEECYKDGSVERIKSLRALEDLIDNVGETFQQMLFRLIKEKGREEVEVYKGAYKDKKLFYKIRNNVNYQPTKHTVYAFAISLKLSLDETIDLLQTAGFAMSNSNRFDLIMTYVFEHQIYDMYKIDCILYDFGEEHFFACE